jgi:hypothetical protein
MSKETIKNIKEESLEAVANMGGDFDEFLNWNFILAMYGEEPIR